MTPLNPASGVTGYSGGASASYAQPEFRHAALIAALAELAPDQAIEQLSASGADIAQLLETLDHAPSLETSVQLAELYRSAVLAASSGDNAIALARLATFASIDPRRAETLQTDPALASIHSEVAQLMAKLTHMAKAGAEARIELATQSFQSYDLGEGAAKTINPKVALLAATQLLDAGGYANFVHSTDLSQLVIDYPKWAPAATEAPLTTGQMAAISPRVFLWVLVSLVALCLIVYSLSR